MSVIKGEGKFPILFGTMSMAAGAVTRDTYLARPDLSGEWPTVVLIPSEWGMTSSVKDVARRIARHGVAAIVVDIYRGVQPERRAGREAAEAAHLELSPGQVVRDIAGVVRYVQNPAGFWSSAEDGFAVLGMGSGGPPAVATAADFEAALILAASPLPIDGLLDITTPILGLFGRDDEMVPLDAVMATRGELPHSEWVLYDRMGHDFLDDYLDGFDLEVLQDAVERIVGFCEKHLGPRR